VVVELNRTRRHDPSAGYRCRCRLGQTGHRLALHMSPLAGIALGGLSGVGSRAKAQSRRVRCPDRAHRRFGLSLDRNPEKGCVVDLDHYRGQAGFRQWPFASMKSQRRMMSGPSSRWNRYRWMAMPALRSPRLILICTCTCSDSAAQHDLGLSVARSRRLRPTSLESPLEASAAAPGSICLDCPACQFPTIHPQFAK
jgi:hypothetical protein